MSGQVQNNQLSFGSGGSDGSGGGGDGEGGGGSGLFAPILGAVPTISSMGLTTALNHSGAYVSSDVSLGVLFTDTTGYHGVEGDLQAYPLVPFTLTALFSIPQFAATSGSGRGLVIANSPTGALLLFNVQDVNPPGVDVTQWSNPNSYAGPVSGLSTPSVYSPFAWLRLKDDGVNITYSISLDGTIFTTMYTVSKASSYLGASGFNYIGVGMTTNDQPSAIVMQWVITTP